MNWPVLRSFCIYAVVILLAAPALAYFDNSDNIPDGPPQNYIALDSALFAGGPEFDTYPPEDLDGYFVYRDTATGRWHVETIVWPGGHFLEQLHGSVLVQLDEEPQEGVNVFPIAFNFSDDLKKNDRWGWVKWPDEIAPNLYEIWWDITIDLARIEEMTDPYDTIGISFGGCAFDFNIWATGRSVEFTEAQVLIGSAMTPLSDIPGFADDIAGLEDNYQGTTPPDDPNTSVFTGKDLPGASYNSMGLIDGADDYSLTYGGPMAYEGNGLQFSANACAAPPEFNCPGNETEFLCEPQELCYDLTLGGFTSLTLLDSPGEIAQDFSQLCFTPDAEGTYTFTIEATDNLGNADTCSFDVTIYLNGTPTVTAPPDTTITSCGPEEICLTGFEYSDIDDNIVDVQYYFAGQPEDKLDLFCFTPDTAGTYCIVIRVIDDCGAFAEDTVCVTVEYGSDVAIDCPQLEPYFLCAPDSICIDIAVDPFDAPLRVLESGAVIDNGRLCFYADKTDIYQFTVVADGDCGSDTCVVTANVTLDSPPMISCPEEPISIQICEPSEVCVDIPIEPSNATVVVDGQGAYYAGGQICFPADESTEYTYTLIATNECGLADTCEVTIAITLEDEIIPDCPPADTSVYLCQPGIVQIPLGGVPDNAEVIVEPSSGYYKDGYIKFDAAQAGEYCFTVTVPNDCGDAATCSFCVTVGIDSPPYVILPDTSVFLCEYGEICLPMEFGDPDDNITIITVQKMKERRNLGLDQGEVCFIPDMGEGTYNIIVTVEDDCGNSDVDTATVYVEFNELPMIAAPDTAAFLCEPGTVCVPVTASDPDGVIDSIVVSEPGYYNAEDGTVCVDFIKSEVIELTMTAYDDCGAAVSTTVTMTIDVNSPPTLTVPADTLVEACDVSEICLTGFAFGDIDGNNPTLSFSPDPGIYEDGSYCFTPEEPGTYTFIVRVTDDCGAYAEDTVVVTYELGQDVFLDCPVEIDTVSLCQPEEICISVPVTPETAEVTVDHPDAKYVDGRLCFMADTAGVYEYTLIAVGDCGNDTCTVTIPVEFGLEPVITCPTPEPLHLCGPEEVIVPLSYAPADAEITLPPNTSLVDGQLIFMADTAGTYCFDITAATECGTTTCSFCITITFDQAPEVSATDSSLTQCFPEEICLPIMFSDVDENIVSVTVSPAEFSVREYEVCFLPEGPGTYTYTVTVTDDCENTTTATGEVILATNIPPMAEISSDTVFLCEPSQSCLTYSATDSDGVIDSIVIVGADSYGDGSACLEIFEPGEYEIIITAYDDCGAAVVDTGMIVADFNSAPSVVFGEFDPFTLCDLEQICVPIIISDDDDNVVTIEKTVLCQPDIDKQPTDDTSDFCFTPTEFGMCSLMVVVIDECGAQDTAYAEVEINEGLQPNPTCPGDTTINLCQPQQICLFVGSLGYNVTVRPERYVYDSNDETLCFMVDETRIDTITVIDETGCGRDSCTFVLASIINTPPEITGPGEADFTFCEDTYTYCFEVDITDADDNIDRVFVEGGCPNAAYTAATGLVCLELTEDVECDLRVIALDDCGKADTLVHSLVARKNIPPEISLPGITTFVRCDTDTGAIVIENICVSDDNYDTVELVLDSGLGEFAYNSVTQCGVLTFDPPSNDSAEYCFKFLSSDSCDTVIEYYCLTVLPTPVCSTCVDVWIEGPDCLTPGATATMNIRASAGSELAGYDLLIAYDGSVLNFILSEIGAAVNGWEYYTYRLGADGNCQGTCPSGLIRLVSIADINNGPFHPPAEQLLPDGVIATMTFRIAGDQNLGGRNIPFSFFWYDCGDNSFSDPSGQYQLVDQAIFWPDGRLVWDEFDDIRYPEASRWMNTGTPDSCITGDKEAPVRCANFHNGDLCIIHPDSIDDRGDINLNGIAYEVADAVVYTNYFIFGISAFTISVPGQIAASDVNADGLALSIADLVYLVRVVIGDALPLPKPIPGIDLTVDVSFERQNDRALIRTTGQSDIGAALFIVHGNRAEIGEPKLAGDAINMELMYSWVDDHTLRMLVYSLERDGRIAAGEQQVLELRAPTNSELIILEAEMADYNGVQLAPKISSHALPGQLALTQNYPNPFNPTTKFEMALPVESDYVICVFNITGQVIRQWTGHAQAGYVEFEWDGTDQNGQTVASGIYFYRARAAGAEAIKKMVLLK